MTNQTVKFVEHRDASNVRRELGMLDEAELLWKERGPRCIALLVCSLRKSSIEVHVVVLIARWFYTRVSPNSMCLRLSDQSTNCGAFRRISCSKA